MTRWTVGDDVLVWAVGKLRPGKVRAVTAGGVTVHFWRNRQGDDETRVFGASEVQPFNPPDIRG